MSTQVLTELPNIQKAGMDFDTVMAEIREIIENNPNWAKNWPEFYDSEAGVLLIQLMSWITDNMSTRQDVLFNEMFLSTAQEDVNKIRQLKQIAYIPMMAHSAKVAVNIEFNKLLKSRLYLTPTANGALIFRPNAIFSFSGKDINGKDVNWEILKIKDGKPSYLDSVMLNPGNTEYTVDNNNNTLYALQGKTVYEEMSTTTNDGPTLTLSEKNISADSIQVYDTKDNSQLLEVSSFVSTDALDKTLPVPYVIEMSETGNYTIRFGNTGILDSSRLLPAGSTVGVFYRTTDGSVGNISPGFINTVSDARDEANNVYQVTISNPLLGAGGTDAESLDKAVLNGPLTLRTMDRAVTPEDYNIILEKNTNIFKSKTYTATNMPLNFKEYYGRYINPQESFSFLLFNKNYKDVPTSMYNYFPWFTSASEPRMNERYVFNTAEYDQTVDMSAIYHNLYLNNKNADTINFKNGAVLKLPSEFNNNLFDENGQPNANLKLKLTTSKMNANFFKDIPFSLFNDGDFSNITMDNPVIGFDTNARFISQSTYDPNEPIDVLDARYITVCFDGKTEIKIDLCVDMANDFSGKHYYLLWTNEGVVNAKSLYGDNDTKAAAKFRNGIVEIINNSLPAVIAGISGGTYDNEISLFDPTTSYQHFALNMTSPISEIGYQAGVYPIELTYNGLRYVFTIDTTSWDNGKYSTEYRSYAWDSLNGLRDIFNYFFGNGMDEVKKYSNGVLIDLDDNDKEVLGNSIATVEENLIFNTDFDNDDDESRQNVYSSWDLVISGKSLTTMSFTDVFGVHNIKNVIDLDDDPFTLEGVNYQGLIHFLKLNESSSPAKLLIPMPLQAAEYKNLASMIPADPEGNSYFFEIKSPIIGSSSSIYFKWNTTEANFMRHFLGLYFTNDGYSYKAYGQKKVYLITKDIIRSYVINNGLETSVDLDIPVGSVIYESNSIYCPDITELYANYKLSTNGSLRLGSVYDNFYYSGDSDIDDEIKQPVVGLSGQYMKFDTLDNGVKSYYIDQNKSNFEIKLTSKPQETNSIYAITTDLDVVACDRVKISTADVKGCPSDVCPLIFSIDDNSSNKITAMLSNCNTGKDVVDTIQFELKNSDIPEFMENVSAICKSSYTSLNQVIISGLSKNDGNVTFYYPDIESYVSQNDVKELYKNFLGTNLTNSDFYKLYPKEDFNNFIVNINEEEYFYCPTQDIPLKFNYRKLIEVINEDGTRSVVSREADYYINVNESSNGEQYIYSFDIVKTDNSKFPDTYFYIHFINNKSYDFDDNNNVKETDDTIIQNYMEKYKISGTDVIFLQPYFRTYDIAATIKYNPNFSETEVVQSVKKAVSDVCDLKYSEIAGSMSRAKILKAIMNCNGVDDCKITYFGFDYSSGKGSTDTLTADFYEILCLHEDATGHGRIFTFEATE